MEELSLTKVQWVDEGKEHLADKREVPHVHVKVSYGGKAASMDCAFFMDSIAFLCECEAQIRYWRKIQNRESDDVTSEITNANLKKLLSHSIPDILKKGGVVDV